MARVGKALLLHFAWVMFCAPAFSVSKPPDLHLSLSDIEAKVLKASYRLKAVQNERESFSEKAEGVSSGLYPRLSIDGTYRYQTVVPSVTLPLGTRPTMRLGGNNNYSLGPTLSWTVWDFGTTRNASKSVLELASSKEEEMKATARELLLNARQSYFRVQWALEQMRLVGDSFNLAELQYRDILRRVHAGASSKVDLLTAHREVNRFSQQFRQIQSDLAGALQELFALTEIPVNTDATVPLIPTLLENPILSSAVSVLVHVDSIQASLAEFSKKQKKLIPPGNSHPLVSRQSHLVQSYQLRADSASGAHWPKLQLQLRSSYDFPNGAAQEWFNQNTLGVVLSMPLWDWGLVSHGVEEDQRLAEGARARRQQISQDLLRDWNKAYSQWVGYQAQSERDTQIVSEAEELSRLVYESYKGGRNTFLEVESANLRFLEAQVQNAHDRIQILNQLAILLSLTEENSERKSDEKK